MSEMGEFLRAIPGAAASPYSLAAYAIAGVLFLFAGARLRTTKLLMDRIDAIPAAERRRALEIATGTVLPTHISPEQWIRLSRMRWTFLLAGSLLIAILTVTTIAIVNPTNAQIKDLKKTTADAANGIQEKITVGTRDTAEKIDKAQAVVLDDILARSSRAQREIWRGYYPLEPLAIVYHQEFPMAQPVLSHYVDRVRADIVHYLRASREGRRKTADDLRDEEVTFILTSEGQKWKPGDAAGEEDSAWALLGQGVMFKFDQLGTDRNGGVSFFCDPALQDVIVAMPAKGRCKQRFELQADFSKGVILRTAICENPIRTGKDTVAISAIDLVGREMKWSPATTSNRDARWVLVGFGMRFAHSPHAEVTPLPPGANQVRITPAHIGLTTLPDVTDSPAR